MALTSPSPSSVAASNDLPPAVRRTFRRFLFVPVWVLLAVPIPAFLLGIELPPAARAAPLIASAVLFGMPHGAVDHLVLSRLRGERPTLRSIGGVVLLYAVLGGGYTLVWFVAPLVAAGLFILMTWFHWGQGELFPLMRVLGADHVGSRLQRGLTLLVRGGLPMLVPLLGFPAVYRRVVEALIAPFTRGGAATLGWLFAADTRLVLAVGFGGLTLVTLGGGYARSDRRRAWAVDAFETCFLWVFFLVVPPVFAIGLYFCLWHSVRHIVRLIAVDQPARAAVERGDLRTAVGRFARDAAPTTLGALLVLGGLYVAVPNPPRSLIGFSGLYLVLIAVLTLPHVVVVTVMDRAQAIW